MTFHNEISFAEIQGMLTDAREERKSAPLRTPAGIRGLYKTSRKYGFVDGLYARSALRRIETESLDIYLRTSEDDPLVDHPEDDLIEAIDEAYAPSFSYADERVENFNDIWTGEELHQYKRVYPRRWDCWEGYRLVEELKLIHPVPEPIDQETRIEVHQTSIEYRRQHASAPKKGTSPRNHGRKPRNNPRRDSPGAHINF